MSEREDLSPASQMAAVGGHRVRLARADCGLPLECREPPTENAEMLPYCREPKAKTRTGARSSKPFFAIGIGASDH